MCERLGRRCDVHLDECVASATEPTYIYLEKMQALRAELLKEHAEREAWIKEVFAKGSALCVELDEPNPFPPVCIRSRLGYSYL